jgi:hypothetical protein
MENRGLRRIFVPKRDEVTGEWRRLHKEELYALYSSPNIIQSGQVKKNGIYEGHIARTVERKNACRVLVGKPFENSRQENFRCRFKEYNNVKLKTRLEILGCVNLAWNHENWGLF